MATGFWQLATGIHRKQEVSPL